MPIKIIQGIPVTKKLKQESIHTIDTMRAVQQDIRPLKILIVNLMPKKETTELQLLRLLGNSPLQVDIDFLHMSTHKSKNTDKSYLDKFYNTFNSIKDKRFDGMIVTGAPVELIDFSDVNYYDELSQVLEWAKTHVYSRFFICWGAQFGLYQYYNINKYTMSQKLFGVYSYQNIVPTNPYLRGFDDYYVVPQSRHTTIEPLNHENLTVLTKHESLGPDIITSVDTRDLFIFGHLEYDRDTLNDEYKRDIQKGKQIQPPENYFLENNPNNPPEFKWKSYGHLLFNNWLNETYQNTPYYLNELE